MKEFNKSIRVLTNEEIIEMQTKLNDLIKYARTMAEKIQEIEEDDKKKSLRTPEYQAAVEKRKTANVKEQYIQIYEYIKSQAKSPWHKYYTGGRSLETLIDKFGKFLDSRNSFTVEQIHKLIDSELTVEEYRRYEKCVYKLRGQAFCVNEFLEPAEQYAYDGSIENKSVLDMAKFEYKNPSALYSGIGGFYGFSGRVKEKMTHFREKIFQNKTNKKTTLRAAEALKTVDEIERSPEYYIERERRRLDKQRKPIVRDIINSIVKKLKEANITPEYVPSEEAYSSNDIYEMEHYMQLQSNALYNEMQGKIKPEDREIIENHHVGDNIDFGNGEQEYER